MALTSSKTGNATVVVVVAAVVVAAVVVAAVVVVAGADVVVAGAVTGAGWILEFDLAYFKDVFTGLAIETVK